MTTSFLRAIWASLLMAYSLVAFNQAEFGIRIGSPTFSSAQVSDNYLDPVSDNYYNLHYISTNGGPTYGLAVYDEFEYLWFMGEASFQQTKVHYQITDLRTYERSAEKLVESYANLNFHISAGYRKGIFKLGVGPIFRYNLDRSTNLALYDEFIPREIKLAKGFQFIVGCVLFDHIHVDIKRELSFYASGDDYNFITKPINLNSHPHTWSVNVGVFL